MWKRPFIVLLAILAGVTFAQKVNIELAEVITSPQRTEFLKSIVSDFEQANPDIKVTITSLPWGQSFEKFLTMVQSGQVPDVAEIPDKWVGLYGSLKSLVDLTPYLDASDVAGNYTDLTWSAAKLYQGTPYVIPYGFYIRALYYNKALFREAGISAPPATLDEFREIAQTISQLPGKYGYCLRGGNGGYGVTIGFMTSFMGSDEWFDEDGNSTFDSPAAVEGFKFQVDMYKDGLAPKDSVNWDYSGVTTGFYSNTCAMFINDPDALSILQDNIADKDDVGVAPIPLGPNGVSFPKVGFAGWGMFNKSEHKDESWKLISYLTSPEVSLKWDEFLGGIIPIYEGADKAGFYAEPIRSAWFTELNDPNYQLRLSYPFDLPELGYLVDQLMVSSTQEALLGQRTPEEVTKEWADYLTKAHKKALASESN